MTARRVAVIALLAACLLARTDASATAFCPRPSFTALDTQCLATWDVGAVQDSVAVIAPSVPTMHADTGHVSTSVDEDVGRLNQSEPTPDSDDIQHETIEPQLHEPPVLEEDDDIVLGIPHSPLFSVPSFDEWLRQPGSAGQHVVPLPVQQPAQPKAEPIAATGPFDKQRDQQQQQKKKNESDIPPKLPTTQAVHDKDKASSTPSTATATTTAKARASRRRVRQPGVGTAGMGSGGRGPGGPIGDDMDDIPDDGYDWNVDIADGGTPAARDQRQQQSPHHQQPPVQHQQQQHQHQQQHQQQHHQQQSAHATQQRLASIVQYPIKAKDLKSRFNYASFDCAAIVRKTNKEAKGATAIITKSKDQYMLNQCSAPNKFVIVELCNTIIVETIALANHEFFSSTFKDFKVYITSEYPPASESDWQLIGTFQARNSRDLQVFQVPKNDLFSRYLKIELLTHYGRQFYCPLSQIQVYGVVMMEDYFKAEMSDTKLEPTPEPVLLPPAPEPMSMPAPLPIPTELPQVSDVPEPIVETPRSDNHDTNGSQQQQQQQQQPQQQPPPPSADIQADKPSATTVSTGVVHEETDTPPTVKSSSSAVDVSLLPSTDILVPAPLVSVIPQPHQPSPQQSQQQQPPPLQQQATLPKAPPVTGQHGNVFKALSKRLSALETTVSLTYRYLEDQSRAINVILARIESSHRSYIERSIAHINATTTRQINALAVQSEEIWKALLTDFEERERAMDASMRDMSVKLDFLAEEVLFGKRMMFAQIVLLLIVVGLVVLSKAMRIVSVDNNSNSNSSSRMNGSGDYYTTAAAADGSPKSADAVTNSGRFSFIKSRSPWRAWRRLSPSTSVDTDLGRDNQRSALGVYPLTTSADQLESQQPSNMLQPPYQPLLSTGEINDIIRSTMTSPVPEHIAGLSTQLTPGSTDMMQNNEDVATFTPDQQSLGVLNDEERRLLQTVSRVNIAMRQPTLATSIHPSRHPSHSTATITVTSETALPSSSSSDTPLGLGIIEEHNHNINQQNDIIRLEQPHEVTFEPDPAYTSSAVHGCGHERQEGHRVSIAEHSMVQDAGVELQQQEAGQVNTLEQVEVTENSTSAVGRSLSSAGSAVIKEKQE